MQYGEAGSPVENIRRVMIKFCIGLKLRLGFRQSRDQSGAVHGGTGPDIQGAWGVTAVGIVGDFRGPFRLPWPLWYYPAGIPSDRCSRAEDIPVGLGAVCMVITGSIHVSVHLAELKLHAQTEGKSCFLCPVLSGHRKRPCLSGYISYILSVNRQEDFMK